MSAIKVHYFPLYGRAEPIRMLLAHAKVDFENVNHTFAELPALKAGGTLEFGQLPVIEVDGKFLAQSGAILRYLGIRFGYYSEDAFTAWRIDSTIDSIGDLMTGYIAAIFNPDEEKKAELLKTYTEVTFPKWLAIIDKRLKENSSQKFIVGDKISIADFILASIAYSSFLNEKNITGDLPLSAVD